MKTVGLCMIVKNEAQTILRALDSVRTFVDYVLVEDTGSTDGTQTIIRDYLRAHGLPGEVFDEPWRDFGTIVPSRLLSCASGGTWTMPSSWMRTTCS